jgi:hypothetical protein
MYLSAQTDKSDSEANLAWDGPDWTPLGSYLSFRLQAALTSLVNFQSMQESSTLRYHTCWCPEGFMGKLNKVSNMEKNVAAGSFPHENYNSFPKPN